MHTEKDLQVGDEQATLPLSVIKRRKMNEELLLPCPLCKRDVHLVDIPIYNSWSSIVACICGLKLTTVKVTKTKHGRLHQEMRKELVYIWNNR